MTAALTIAGRELRAYFLTPAGYIITALFVLFAGFVFAFRLFDQGEIASMRRLFEICTWALVFVGPAITMCAISEELRLGTFETLMTSPVSEGQVIFGKFLASLGFLVLMLVPTGFFVLALEIYGRPDYGELLCGYAGMVLSGSAYMASGILASVLTSSQVVAYLIAVFFWLSLGIGTKLLPQYLPGRWADVVFAIDPDLRLKDFAIGLADSGNVIYFISLTALFLLAAGKILEWRRWR